MVSTVVVGDAVCSCRSVRWPTACRGALFSGCADPADLGLAIPLLLNTPLIWPLWVLFGASAGGLFTLSLVLIGELSRR
jgi:hypothetical protein